MDFEKEPILILAVLSSITIGVEMWLIFISGDHSFFIGPLKIGFIVHSDTERFLIGFWSCIGALYLWYKIIPRISPYWRIRKALLGLHISGSRIIDFSDAGISEIDLSPFELMHEIDSINLNNNCLQSVDLTPLGECGELRELVLSNNNLDSIDITPFLQK